MSEQSDDIETRRDRLIKYLLDEVEPEEKFEIERLCNLDADWRAEKKLVQQSLSLFQAFFSVVEHREYVRKTRREKSSPTH